MPTAEQSYFVVTMGDDGLMISEPLSRDELLKRLAPEPHEEDFTYYGRIKRFLTEPPKRSQDWDGALLIIRGSVVVPKPVEVVKKFEVP